MSDNFTTTVEGAAAYERLHGWRQHPIASADVRGKAAYELSMVALAKQGLDEARKGLVEAVKAASAAGATNQEIGDVLGVTRQRVSQLLRKQD